MPAAQKAASAWLYKPDASPAAPAGVTVNQQARYTRAQRILKADEFSSAFRLRPVFRTSNFTLYARSNGLAQARLGVVAAKRLAQRAATRNMIKRIAREVFRQSDLPPLDCIIRLSSAVNTKAGPASSAVLKKRLREQIMTLLASQLAAEGKSR